MRNLKKFLALVLAMMMAFSLMVTVNAASLDDYADKSSVDSKYATAVDTLTRIGIFEGTSTGTATFSPTQTITRAEMAAIAYRVMTADVGDENVGLYANMTTPFTDVGNKWWTPYINYAWNAQIIVGDGNGHFFPDMEINGYQVLAILLRMIGYNQPGEFEGKGWELHTAQIAAQLHVSDNLTSALSAKTPRQEVAQMVYNAVQTPQVVYTPAGGYSQYVLGAPNSVYYSLITWEEGSSRNVWGAPSDLYYDVVFHYANKSIDGDDFTVPYPVIWDTYDAVVECDVYDNVVGKTGNAFTAYTYTNGKINSGTVTVEALDTINKIGHEGRHTSVYANPDYISASKTPNIHPYIITYVDTYLAQVIDTWDEVTDPASHVKKPAGATLAVYFNDLCEGVNNDGRTTVNLTVTGTGYTVGDLLAVNLTNPRSAGTTGTTNIISNSLSNANYSPAKIGSQIEGKPALSTSTVTVKYILFDKDSSSNARIVGFADTNGNQHYYNLLPAAATRG